MLCATPHVVLVAEVGDNNRQLRNEEVADVPLFVVSTTVADASNNKVLIGVSVRNFGLEATLIVERSLLSVFHRL